MRVKQIQKVDLKTVNELKQKVKKLKGFPSVKVLETFTYVHIKFYL